MRKITLLTLSLLAATTLPARASYAAPVALFTIADPGITEASGLVASSRSDSVWFTHNDSGDTGRFYALGPDGSTLATYNLTPPERAALDWEDIARGPGGDGEPALFLGDIGDNPGLRPFVEVFEVPEPVVDESRTGVQTDLVPTTHVLMYEDGPHNAETLLVDPRTREIAIITKEASGVDGVYVALPAAAGVAVLRRVATIDVKARASETSSDNWYLTTGGDIAADRSRVVVRTYKEAFEWALGTDSLATAFARAPERIALPDERQGEAIAYARDGSGLVTTSEGENQNVWLLRAA